MGNANKVALVTGASSGIGEATVLSLLAAGYVVYGAARRVERMRGIEQQGAHVLALDLTGPDSIARTAATIEREQSRLDLLVNNAGYGAYGAVEDIPMEEARRQFEVNLFGLADLTRRFLPLMRQARSGRIVNVTSIGGKIWSPYGAWYQATKFALEGFSDCLRLELKPFGIDVVVVEPGAIRTEWGDIAAASAKRWSSQSAYAPITQRMTEALGQFDGRGAAPSVVADAIVQAATARRPRTRYVSPASARLFLLLPRLGDRAFDRVISAMFRLPKTIP